MFEPPDQLELLALIEGELDAAAEAALRSRLVAQPHVLAMIHHMQMDRAELRRLPEPGVPRDFLIELEPFLARAMLIDATSLTENVHRAPKPGEFRRQHHRRTRRIRWSRLSLAAMLFLGMVVGVWAIINGIVTDRIGTEKLISEVGSPNDSDASQFATNTPIGLSGMIHHHLPEVANPAVEWARSKVGEPTVLFAAGPFTAPFMVVVHTTKAEETEALLVAETTRKNPQVAVIRNFNFQEARQLSEELLTSAAEHEKSTSPMTASVVTPNTSIKILADRVRRQQTIKQNRKADSSISMSGSLAGPTDIAPTLEQQLEYSRRGATHTLAIPASIVTMLLQKLALVQNQSMAIRPLPSTVSSDVENISSISDSALSSWLSDASEVRRAMDEIERLPPDTIVLVPVALIND